MPASEHEAQSRPSPAAFSMRDLLASCAAASAVSTPPCDRGESEPAGDSPGERTPHREAA
ncbi:hypothetical protein ACFWZY_11615 [Streptomyces sp. NPDC058992]|uniref:hypothetical protein n=1 Tax=Streptomyces sp. NPDC058992 TaxID=3346688 RepID=UPI0036996581